ncbi:MAG: diaminopimelate epimerase [Sedimenticolaceae bacterium]|nr:diaminopimelate epimerase [Sedimenticolaceae bacterium]
MELKFTKMQGAGNDFVVFNAIDQQVELDREQLQRIADRHFGIGCDQVLLVEPPRIDGTEFHYRIFNADGGEVEQCGNGARCFARYVREKGLSSSDALHVGTAKGRITLYLEESGQVRVIMGVPKFEPADLPFLAETNALYYGIDLDGAQYHISVVSMGNPHAVLLVDDIESAPVETIGPLLESHPRFPQRVNVGFMEHRSRDRIALRVYERGAGETLACGTGACAAVVSGIRQNSLDREVTVELKGGQLVISWAGEGEPVWMTGPAETVYEGVINL